jgi:hypothetical protein
MVACGYYVPRLGKRELAADSLVSENCQRDIHNMARLVRIYHAMAGEAGITRIMSALSIPELYNAHRIM